MAMMSGKFLPLYVKVVSSANKSDVRMFDTDAKSLMYIRKRRGPRMEPCGTPQLILMEVEFELL